MKRTLLFLLAAVVLPFCVVAQQEPFLWPVPQTQSDGKSVVQTRAGDGILYAPQTYIGDELNFANLFIAAPEGAPVVAPTDGEIVSFGATYCQSLNYQIGNSFDPAKDGASQLAEFAAEFNGKMDPRYAHVSVGISLVDGRTIWIGGLKADKVLKTGEKVKRGQQLGTVWYSYEKIKEPSINLSISDRAGACSDPMTPFGIPTTFIAPKAMPEITSLTGDQAREDFTTFIEVLREAYPGLHDAVTPEQLEEFCRTELAAIPDPISIEAFYRVMKRTVSKLHDSHLYLYPPEKERQRRSIDLPQIYFGWIDSALVATRCTAPYKSYYGRRIRSVDGIPGDSLRDLASCYISGYDGCVESTRDYALALGLSGIYFRNIPGASPKCDVRLEFEDGELLDVKGWTYTGRDDRGLAPDWRDFILTNSYRDANFAIRELNDSTSYLGISTFQLNQIEVDSIASYLRSVAHKPNMIVDVRNNGGGDVNVLGRILSYFALKPLVKLESYSMMRKPGGFKTFTHCLNYTSESEIMSGFEPVEGREGYYSFEEEGVYPPDSVTSYRGRLYVLVDENSCSAATIFPATILRNHRGVLVGRETQTAYHFMNALKFADIRLPNSWLTVRVPLVRLVFDTTENPRIPYGRGVLPDYEVRLSLDEIAAVRGDSILNYTLALVDRGAYLGEDPFAVETPRADCFRWWLVGAAVFVVAVVAGIRLGRRRKA